MSIVRRYRAAYLGSIYNATSANCSLGLALRTFIRTSGTAKTDWAVLSVPKSAGGFGMIFMEPQHYYFYMRYRYFALI